MAAEISTLEGRTLGQRIERAAGHRGFKTPAALARAVSETGYSVTRQTMANLWSDRVDNPREDLLDALEPILGITKEEMRHGPRVGDSLFVAEMRGLEVDLEESQQDQLLYLANEMAKETRKRREAIKREELTAEEEELIALMRSDSLARAALLGAARELAQQDAPQETSDQEARPRRRRGESA